MNDEMALTRMRAADRALGALSDKSDKSDKSGGGADAYAGRRQKRGRK